MGNQNKLLSQKTSVTSSKIIEFKANKEIGITKNKKKNGKLIMDEHIQTGKVIKSITITKIKFYYKHYKGKVKCSLELFPSM